jgi:hypothetical protein
MWRRFLCIKRIALVSEKSIVLSWAVLEWSCSPTDQARVSVCSKVCSNWVQNQPKLAYWLA